MSSIYSPARFIAMACIVILTLCAGLSPAADKKFKIYPLGDSITQSKKKNFCWRYWLWLKLKENDFANQVDFVGSSSGPSKDWDCQHDGHWGASTKEILNGLKKWAPQYKADISLIHLGTNDMKRGDVKLVVGWFEEIISLLRANNDSVGVIVGQIPSWSTRRDSIVSDFNNELLTLKELNTPASPIRVIDLSIDYDRKADNYDGLHPNESGAKKYAKLFYPALVDMMNYRLGLTPSIPRLRDKPIAVISPWHRIKGQLFISTPALPETKGVFLSIQGKRIHQD